MAEVLLLLAARTMHVEKIIRPALGEGTIVISDRFSDSTIAYQGYGHGVDLEKIKQLDALVIDGLKPDLTFVLDIAPAEGVERSRTRLKAEPFEDSRSEDRFERMDLSFHEKIRQAFLDIAAAEPERCVVLDATMSIEALSAAIAKTALERLG